MAKRNPEETIAALRDELAAKDEQIDQLEETRDRLRGRLSRIESVADVSDIVDEDDIDDDDIENEDED